ncbi:MAG TPA: response regulator [Myxococcales bacterium]|nr:response regulator [Myxococcales bacterium]
MPALLGNGSRVAILGGGPAGACAAAALLSCARRLGRIIEVCVYHAPATPDELAEPLVVDQPTVVRLASLGVGVPQTFLTRYQGVAFHGTAAASPLVLVRRPIAAVAPGPPAAAFRRLLRGVAAGLGARLVASRATLLPGSSTDGGPEIRARGLVQAAERTLVTCGVRDSAGALAGGARGLRPGSCLWLGATRPFPSRFAAWVHVFARPRHEGWLWVAPVGQRLYAGGSGEAPEVVGRLMALQRDGLLPIELAVEHAWSRPWRPRRGRAREDGGLRLGEAATALWPLSAFPVAVREALRLAEDLLALPAGEDAAERRRFRSRAAERQAASRWRFLEKGARLDPTRAASIRAFTWMFEDGTSERPAVPLPGPSRLWQRWRRWLRSRRLRRLRPPAPAAASLVYVVDDDASSRTLLARWLEERGLRVRAFGDEMALPSRAARERPGAILLDVVLDRIDGLTLLDRLQLDPATRAIPVLLMSGADLELGAGRARPHAFLSKPLDLPRLWELLRPIVSPNPVALERSTRPA